MKSKTISLLCYIKIHESILLRLDLLPTNDFVTSCIGDMKNISSLNYAEFSIVDILHYTASKKIHH